MSQQWLRDLSPFFAYLLAVATIGPFLFGYHLAELNAPQEVLTCVKKQYTPEAYLSPLPECIPMTTFEFGLVTSIFTLGGLVGALYAGIPAAKYGRLATMRYTTALFTAGAIAESCAPNVAVMALGRFVSGLGCGCALVVVPLYIAEISPFGKRGFFGSFTQVMTNFGILVTQALGLFLSKGNLWRVILGIGGVVGLNQLAALFFAVESPKWQADHGRAGEAKKDLRKIRGPDCDIRAEIAAWEVGAIEPDEDDEREGLVSNNRSQSPLSATSPLVAPLSQQQHVGLLRVLIHPQYRRATLVVMMVMVAQQFTGINSIVMYGVSILSDLLDQSSALLNVFVAALNLIVTITCAPLSDRLGRKPCLLMSIMGMGVSSMLLGIAITNGIAILSAITTLTFVGSFGIGLGPIPFILASELAGTDAVGPTQSWALGANWISTFVVAQFFPPLNQALGKGRVYFLFAFLAVVFAALVSRYVPETKGKSNADEVWGTAPFTDTRPD